MKKSELDLIVLRERVIELEERIEKQISFLRERISYFEDRLDEIDEQKRN